MAGVSTELTGPRLAFVIRKLPGTVQRSRYTPPPSKKDLEKAERDTAEGNVVQTVIEEAGYMLFLPTGSCYRLTESMYRRMGYDKKQPNILGFETANKPDTAVGRFKLASTEAARKAAYAEMEDEVIKSCLRRIGSIENAIADYDPKGKVPHDRAA